jgi:hypothetical protein
MTGSLADQTAEGAGVTTGFVQPITLLGTIIEYVPNGNELPLLSVVWVPDCTKLK